MASGTLSVLDDDGLIQIDLSSGLTRRIDIVASDGSDMISPGWGGLLIWPRRSPGTPHLVSVDGQVFGGEIVPLVRSSRRYLPGPDDAVWVEAAGRSTDSGRVWRLIDAAGEQRVRTTLPGSVISDGADGLFGRDGNDVHEVKGDGKHARWAGGVPATGPDGYEALHCRKVRCSTVLRDRLNSRETQLSGPTAAEAVAAGLAPGNRLVAATAFTGSDNTGPMTVRVSVLASGQDLRSFPGGDGETAVVWASERWLIATRTDGLTLYDAVEDKLVLPDLPLRDPDQLVFEP